MIFKYRDFDKKNNYNHLLKKNGFFIIKNVLSNQDFKHIESLIVNTAKIYIKNNINNFNDKNFHKELIKLRSLRNNNFSKFFDSLQTSILAYEFWLNKKILKIVKNILKCKIEEISATDFRIRLDPPIDNNNDLDWHQDSSYFRQNKNDTNGLVCWLPLTNLTFNMGPLEILDKSHKFGSITTKKLKKFGTTQRKIDNKFIKIKNLKKFELKLGDILFLNINMIHRSGKNNSDIFRISNICRFHKIDKNNFNPGMNIFKYNDKKINKEVHGF
jgi:ectoine hydroxylase-related dioxygenase (phytanoyl-CoA dioxygenase family)